MQYSLIFEFNRVTTSGNRTSQENHYIAIGTRTAIKMVDKGVPIPVAHTGLLEAGKARMHAEWTKDHVSN